MTLLGDRDAPARARVAWAAHGAADARRLLRAALHTAGVRAAVADDAELVAAELLGNAVRHGAPLGDGTMEVQWSLDLAAGDLRLQVRDGGGGGAPVRRRAGSADTSGRGLLIVEHLAAEWGWQAQPDGSRLVWARLPLR